VNEILMGEQASERVSEREYRSKNEVVHCHINFYGNIIAYSMFKAGVVIYG
jgi:hypothetical protein